MRRRLLINPRKIYYPLIRSANFYYKDATLLDLKLCIFLVLGVFFVHSEMARFRAILPFLATIGVTISRRSAAEGCANAQDPPRNTRSAS